MMKSALVIVKFSKIFNYFLFLFNLIDVEIFIKYGVLKINMRWKNSHFLIIHQNIMIQINLKALFKSFFHLNSKNTLIFFENLLS